MHYLLYLPTFCSAWFAWIVGSNQPTSRHILPLQIDMLQSKRGRTFTVYVCCDIDGKDSTCSNYFSRAKSLLNLQIGGQHVWLVILVEELITCIASSSLVMIHMLICQSLFDQLIFSGRHADWHNAAVALLSSGIQIMSGRSWYVVMECKCLSRSATFHTWCFVTRCCKLSYIVQSLTCWCARAGTLWHSCFRLLCCCRLCVTYKFCCITATCWLSYTHNRCLWTDLASHWYARLFFQN